MNHYESIKNKILNEGYRIDKVEYTNRLPLSGVKETIYVYEVNKPDEGGGRSVACEIARDIAKMMQKETGCIIHQERKYFQHDLVEPVKPGCVRTFHYD